MSNIIVMAFSPRNIVGCLLIKKRLQRVGGGGVTGTPGPPRYALAVITGLCHVCFASANSEEDEHLRIS